jgi:hypothetical protein
VTRAHDTSVAAREAQVQAFRRLSPAERVAIACQMSDEARQIAADGLRHRHPDMSDAEVPRAGAAISVLGAAGIALTLRLAR